MTSVFRLTGIFIIGLAAVVAAMSIGGNKAQASGATINCQIPLAVVCDIHHDDGIANVTVAVDFGDLGIVDVVDKDFDCETDVQISWDPIVPNADIQVTPCDGFGLKFNDDDGQHALGLAAKIVPVVDPIAKRLTYKVVPSASDAKFFDGRFLTAETLTRSR